MASADCQFLKTCWCKNLSTEFIGRTNINQLGCLVGLLRNFHYVRQKCSQRQIGSSCCEVSLLNCCWNRSDCTTFFDPLIATTIEDAHVFNAVRLEDPYTPCREPIVFVTVQNNCRVIIDSSRTSELLKSIFFNDVSIDRIHEIGVPYKLGCTSDVPLLVETWIGADLDNPNFGIIEVLL